MKLGFLQFDCRENAREENLAAVSAAASQAQQAQCDVLVLPELWPCGYDLQAATRGRSWGPPELEFLRQLSTDSGLAIIGGSLLWPTDSASDSRPSDPESSNPDRSKPDRSNPGAAPYQNTAVVIDGGNELYRYSKVHLFAPLAEDRYLRRGEQLPRVFELQGWKCACTVCYDLRFPELYRPLAASGVELVVVVAQWPEIRINHWRALLEARAIENQCYVLGVNRRGYFGSTLFGGGSRLIGPWGEVSSDAGEESGLFIAEIDRAEVAAAREKLPVLGDRRTDLYS